MKKPTFAERCALTRRLLRLNVRAHHERQARCCAGEESSAPNPEGRTMSKTLYLQSRTLCAHDMEVEPTAAPAVIGRGTDADIRPSFHPMLSRRHCRVRWTGNRWLIEDLGSNHGTFVNGERLNGNAVALFPGDTVILAHKQLTYTVGQA
jgi:hypothetical protein